MNAHDVEYVIQEAGKTVLAANGRNRRKYGKQTALSMAEAVRSVMQAVSTSRNRQEARDILFDVFQTTQKLQDLTQKRSL